MKTHNSIVTQPSNVGHMTIALSYLQKQQTLIEYSHNTNILLLIND